jgi:precorrin-6A/cobalt-precorrin-6A reductase
LLKQVDHSIGQVWLIGGTHESAVLAKALSTRQIPYVVTVTTAAASKLYAVDARVWIGQLTPETIQAFVLEQNVRCILDASHPFAIEISRGAIALSQSQPQNQSQNQSPQRPLMPYLRYERPAIEYGTQQESLVTTVDSIEALVASDLLHHQRVLFTLGYRQLIRFAPLRASAKLFARVLPSEAAIKGALAAGFAPAEMIALRPPICAALEKALWQQWKISCVVAKASGQPGGETIKRQVAEQLGTRLILIQRPPMSYPKQTNSISEAIKFCAESLRLY